MLLPEIFVTAVLWVMAKRDLVVFLRTFVTCFRLMDGMAAEYTASLQQTSVNGFGYFIAIPSLHVALAVVLQAMLRFSPGHFWAFLPVNLVLVLSTVLLGYHYLIDAVAGVALGTLVMTPGWRRTQVRQLQDDACVAVAGRDR